MKNQIIIPALFALAITLFNIHSTYAQSENPPAQVTHNFSLKYPQAKIKRWKKQGDTYAVKFSQNGRAYQASFSASGNWLKTTSKISWPANLPANVRAALRQSKYAAWRINQSQSAETPASLYYKVWVDDALVYADAYHQNVMADNRLLTLTADGKIINNERFNPSAL